MSEQSRVHYPVEKFSPPSDTGESRSRNTLELIVTSGDSSTSDGIR